MRPTAPGRRSTYSAACCATVGCSAGDRGAAHVARLRLVVAAHAVHGLAVVPHHEVMQRPFVDVDEFGLRGVLVEVAQQQPRLRHAHALDGAGMRRQIQRLAAMHRMGAHQPLQHRLEHFLFFVGVIEEAERSARIHQRMLADHVLDLGLGLVVERVIGRAHVGEFGVAALRVHHPRRQQREFRRDRPERLSECHRQLPRLNRCGAAVARQRLAVLAEVGDVVQAGRQPVVFLLGHGAAARIFALAEIQREGQSAVRR